MLSSCTIPHIDTQAFSKLVIDYLNEEATLLPFIQGFPSRESILQSINHRQATPTNREALHRVLTAQYKALDHEPKALENIESLLSEDTMSICTAHQPCLLGGPLFVLYKAIHTIVLAQQCKLWFPNKHFVPVFYIGSEDNDLSELNHLYWYHDKITWRTDQTGAVGRMNNAGMDEVLQEIKKYFNPKKEHHVVLWEILEDAYRSSNTVAIAFQKLLHGLLGAHGLVVLNPDEPALKSEFKDIIIDELLHSHSEKIVLQSSAALGQYYKVQASPRSINLFYLNGSIRNRIVKQDNRYEVIDTTISWDKDELLAEVDNHPDRFSPNVILRPLYQERILPNVAWIGGGGELAYWMQLKDLFEHYKIPFPILVLRQSALLLNRQTKNIMNKAGVTLAQIWNDNSLFLKEYIHNKYADSLDFSSVSAIQDSYRTNLLQKTNAIDPTLNDHAAAIIVQLNKKVKRLEYKMYKALLLQEDVMAQRWKEIKNDTHPLDTLQERVFGLVPVYLEAGDDWIVQLLNHSLPFGDQFLVVEER